MPIFCIILAKFGLTHQARNFHVPNCIFGLIFLPEFLLFVTLKSGRATKNRFWAGDQKSRPSFYTGGGVLEFFWGKKSLHHFLPSKFLYLKFSTENYYSNFALNICLTILESKFLSRKLMYSQFFIYFSTRFAIYFLLTNIDFLQSEKGK